MMEYPSHPQHAQQYLRHDAETFRVAEELMMLSNCAVTSSVGSADSYTQHHHHAGKKLHDDQQYSASSYEQMQPVKTTSVSIKREQRQKNRKRQQKAALNVIFDAVCHATKQTNNNRHEDSEQLTRSAPGASTPHSSDILNSRCDVSHSQLLKEHRSRFRQVRRRLSIEQRLKNRAYLDRFHVQGIPLVQHLESLSHWR